MKSRTVFYIHERLIKFLRMAGGKPLVTGFETIPIDGKTDVQISQALAAFIQKRKLNFKENRVTVVIPRSRAILRFLTVPSQKPDEIRSMIDLQLESLMPYTKNEVEFDFQVLSRTTDGYSKLAVVIVPREEAMRYWQIFSAAKVPVSGISISTAGLWLLYKQFPQVFERPGAVLDLDRDHSEICLCHKTQWLASREIPVGFEQIEQGGDAELLKQWDLTLANAQKDKIALECLYLVSSSAKSEAIALRLADHQKGLSVKTVVLYKIFRPLVEGEVSFAALAGLAFCAENPPIDLVPEAIKKSQRQKLYARQSMVLGIWLLAALLSLGAALSMGFFRKNMQLARLETQLHEARQEAGLVEKQSQKIETIEKTIKNRLVFVQLADQLDRLLPAQMYLVNINITGGNNLSLEGVSANPVAINQLQRDMVASQKFTKVGLDYVNKRVTQQGEVDYFKITCVLRAVDDIR